MADVGELVDAIITVVRFPHRTRDVGSVPPDGHGGVGWEPELTPHNNCLAEAVPPVTQSNSESDGEEKWKGKEHRRTVSVSSRGASLAWGARSQPWQGQLPGTSWRAWGLAVVEARSLGVGVEEGGLFQAEGVAEEGPYPAAVEVRNRVGEEAVVVVQNLVVVEEEGEAAGGMVQTRSSSSHLGGLEVAVAQSSQSSQSSQSITAALCPRGLLALQHSDLNPQVIDSPLQLRDGAAFIL
ncbi:hypothetical protein EYF80_019151 [Liparis tanakae]|uniref:Uncharacterized protein n=1 Tax=Liparis tanakae TaxID=230148 RepID=A0A4Z2HXZ5_9TELE|nr:hypothetical protein EYF80_019151 [Liparis tanakae]